jgi:hypothetical protein
MSDFEHKKDNGRLNAAKSKLKDTSPDYWGELCIDVKDMTNITKTPDGYYVFPLSGWKKTSKAGNVYLSLSIKRRGKDDVNQAKDDDMNDPIPF